MIGEAMPRYVGADKGWEKLVRWYKQSFEMIRMHLEMKAISHINWEWVSLVESTGLQLAPTGRTSRLETDDLVRDPYVEGCHNPSGCMPGCRRIILRSPRCTSKNLPSKGEAHKSEERLRPSPIVSASISQKISGTIPPKSVSDKIFPLYASVKTSVESCISLYKLK